MTIRAAAFFFSFFFLCVCEKLKEKKEKNEETKKKESPVGPFIPRKRVCRILIVQQSRRSEVGSTVLHWSLWEVYRLFAAVW